MKRLLLLALATLALLLSGCGDDIAAEANGAEAEGDGGSLEDLPEEIGDDIAAEVEDLQDAEGGGSATFTVGEETWTFDSVLCAFGEETIGQEGAVFNLSSIQDGLQMYASIDSFGHSVSLNDIDNFDDPSVDLNSVGGAEIIELDGNNVSAAGEFYSGDDLANTTPGTFTAQCP